jgi:hypothetical protein
MDIKQCVDACAALTLGKDMVFRDYAQGAFRMRGIGKGQTICLLIVPEIEDRIFTQVAIGAGTAIENVVTRDPRQLLRDVLSWLVINSMRVDGIQFNLLCEQSVANIWRKRAFKTIKTDYGVIDRDNLPDQVLNSILVFRERVDHEIENAVPKSERYSEKIRKLIETHKHMLSNEEDSRVASKILSHIMEEEARSDEIKRQATNNALVGRADALDLNGVAAEQRYSLTHLLTHSPNHLLTHSPNHQVSTVSKCKSKSRSRSKSKSKRKRRRKRKRKWKSWRRKSSSTRSTAATTRHTFRGTSSS